MSQLSDNLVNMIIDYLPYNEQKNINKEHSIKIYKILKKNANIIEKFYIKNKCRIITIMENISDFQSLININKKDLQSAYILLYEEEYRFAYMHLTLVNSRPLNYNSLNIIFHNENMSLNRKFTEFIKRLQPSELAYIGW